MKYLSVLDVFRSIFTKEVRAGIYAVAIAGAALLTFYGVIPPEAAPLWLALVLALLNVRDAK